MRLADMLLAGVRDPRRTAHPDDVLKSIRSNVLLAKVVEATNVYTYCCGQQVALYDLPCAAPPHDHLLVEWMQRNGKRLGTLGICRKGPFLVGDQPEDEQVGENGFRKLRPPGIATNLPWMWLSENLTGQADWDQVRWVWQLGVFQEDGGRAYGPLATVQAALDRWGRLLDVVYDSHVPTADLQPLTLYPVQVFMTTVSFMQCANIRTVYVDPPAALSRKHRRKGHIADDLVRYGVLRLDSIGPEQKTRSRRGDGPVGLTGFHVVRGEFHHYGDCCPGAHPAKGKLFGLHTGRFWFPSHARGNPRRGVVSSSFEMKPVAGVQPEDH